MAFPPSHTFIFQTHEDHHHPLHSTSTFPSFPHFQGVGGGGDTSANFLMKRSMSFSGTENTNYKCDEVVMHHGGDNINNMDELSDDGSLQLGEKKKRLSLEQVKALEKSFEVGNKLEPERKMQLAKALGLQPRQVAIWFQNRRARWKTKQLEKEYDVLKKQFDALKADNETLKTHNQKLQAELQSLKGRDLCETGTISFKKENNEGSWSNGSDNCSSDINLELSRTPMMNSPSHQNGKTTILPTSLKPTTSITQLLQCSSRSDLQEESFSNMFHNIDEQQINFWPWPQHEQHHFH